jgi:E3 ubiquitin-protein ligase BIG BROTHER-like protein
MANPPVLKLGGHGPVLKTPSLAAVAPDMGILSQLVSMGFTIERAKKALIETRNNIGQALDWLDKNAEWEVPADLMNQSLLEVQPGFGTTDTTMTAVQAREYLGHAMDVDPPAHKTPELPSAVAIASLEAAASPAAPLVSRYETNSKDAYRERKRQKEIEKARMEKQAQVEEAARLRAEVAAERATRAGNLGASGTDTAVSAGHAASHATREATGGHLSAPLHSASSSVGMSPAELDAHTAELKAFEERKRQREAEEERKRKAQEAADRERIRREIEEERASKFGTAASEKSGLSAAEQKAAYEAKQKEKQKEAWKLEQEANQRRLAELRQQLKEDRERKESLRQAAKSSAAQPSTAAPKVCAAPAPSAAPRPPSDASAMAVDPTLPKKSVAEELAEARRARLGITTVTGTQAHAGSTPYRPSQATSNEDEDDAHMGIDEIKARNKARAKPSGISEAAPAAPVAEPEPSGPESLRDMHQRRHEAQRRKEQEEAERKARADRAARMIANTASLASSTSPTPTSPTPSSGSEGVFFSNPAASTSMMDTSDIPLETSLGDLPEPLVEISLRLPDGRVKRARFKARDPVTAVHKYAASWLPLETIFTLLIPMPRREFTEESMHTVSLSDAGLAPRGTLTVLLLQNRGQVTAAPPRPANLLHMMNMVNYNGSEMEAAEELANMSYEDLLALQERLGYVPTGLTDREIAALPSSSYRPDPSSDDGAFCLVCQEDIEPNSLVVTLPKCNHIFHKQCVQQWLKDNRTCPTCRTRIYIGKSQGSSSSTQHNRDEDDEQDPDQDSSSHSY